MKTDVTAVIAALVTERNAIDRAIAALSAIGQPTDVVTPQWSQSGRRKSLTASEREEILARLHKGESYAAVASAYDVTRQRLYQIRSVSQKTNGASAAASR